MTAPAALPTDASASDAAMDAAIFANYQAAGGTMAREVFNSRLEVFFEMTCEPYTFGEPCRGIADGIPYHHASRRGAWRGFVAYMRRHGHDRREAHRVFEAVDDFSAYS